ncbi:unnamed protein product [Moneuplotes crassus]|uniref:BolA-like protein n=1 Tax=Euplotes crassus TaxID=5936 RepID=A0AAD2D9A0_EUPCR|nr:unnamed protein product [Moneuplotes crassus]
MFSLSKLKFSSIKTLSNTLVYSRLGFFSTSIRESMEAKLREKFNPTYLQINQEGDDKVQVIIESEEFVGQPILRRHRAVNDLLKDEITQIHAFTLDAKPPSK